MNMNEKKNVRKKRHQHPLDEKEILGGLSKKLSKHEMVTRGTFATRLNKLLDDRKINQNEFAKMVSISDAAVSSYRHGQAEPKISVIAQMARALEVSTDYLIGLSDIESPNLEDISINRMLGLSGRAIEVLKMYKIESESVLPSAPRLKVLNYLLEQEMEVPLNGPANEDDIATFEEIVDKWDKSHPRLLKDILDYLLIKPNPENTHTVTYEGIKESLDPNFNLLSILSVKQTAFDDEIIKAIYTERITHKLESLKTNFNKDLGDKQPK